MINSFIEHLKDLGYEKSVILVKISYEGSNASSLRKQAYIEHLGNRHKNIELAILRRIPIWYREEFKTSVKDTPETEDIVRELGGMKTILETFLGEDAKHYRGYHKL